MELIQSEQPEVPSRPEPRYEPQSTSTKVVKTEHGQTWLRVLIGVLVAIILIVLIVFLARWIYHKTHHSNSQTKGSATSQSASDITDQNSTSASQLQGSSNKNGSSNTTNSPSSTTAPTNSNTQITDTGPGNVVALFVGSSLVAGGLHYLINVRRFAKNQV